MQKGKQLFVCRCFDFVNGRYDSNWHCRVASWQSCQKQPCMAHSRNSTTTTIGSRHKNCFIPENVLPGGVVRLQQVFYASSVRGALAFAAIVQGRAVIRQFCGIKSLYGNRILEPPFPRQGSQYPESHPVGKALPHLNIWFGQNRTKNTLSPSNSLSSFSGLPRYLSCGQVHLLPVRVPTDQVRNTYCISPDRRRRHHGRGHRNDTTTKTMNLI